MSIRVPWNKYETALLVEAYVKVREGVIRRDEAVRELSELLRAYGKANKIEIDDVYRNTNGISMRMAEIERLFNGGVGGIKNTSKLFIETVALYNTDKDQFNLVLREAKRMTSQKKTNKESFLEWLYLQPKLKMSPDRIISLLDEGSIYAVAHSLSKSPFWDIDDPKTFTASCNSLLGSRIYRMLHRNSALALDKCYVFYKEYLIEKAVESERILQSNMNETLPVVTASVTEETADSSSRTETDKKLLSKYPVLFNRIYISMKEYGDITVTAQNVHEKIGRISRLSTVKHILDYASWSEHKGDNYKFSPNPIVYSLPDDQLSVQPSISSENDFYHWLETVKELSASDCGRYTSGINVLSRFLNNECGVDVNLYKIQDIELLSDYLVTIDKHPSYIALAENQRNRFSSSMKLYMEYLSALHGVKSKATVAAAKAKEKDFRQWAALRVGPEKARSYADILKFIEDRCIENQLINRPFYELDKETDFSAVKECIGKHKFPFTLQKANLTEAIEALPVYIDFLSRDDKAAKPFSLPKNVKVLNFRKIGDLSYTKPVRLKFFGNDSTDFNSWADLYTKLLYMLRINHPRILSDGTSLSKSTLPDISANPTNMRAPKAIGKDLYVETNQDTRGLVNRMMEALAMCGVSLKKIEIYYIVREKTIPSNGSQKIAVDPQQMSRLMSYLKAFDNGISLDEIRTKFPDVKPGTLKAILDTDNAIVLNDKYYHRSNIEDLEEAADIILSTLRNQFQRESGYTSAKMLYDELHVRLEDFLFDNGKFDSQIELYDLSRYLFEKVRYKGFAYIFADNKHIWEAEPDYPKTYLGLLSHWAKLQKGFMSRDEIMDRLVSIGSSSPKATFSWLMLAENQNPKEKIFLMYDEYRYVLTEACHIDEAFLTHLRMSLEELFEGDDYLSMDDIDEYFYTTLPDLPSGAIWSPHMLKSVLAFYDVGFSTVAVGGDNDIKVPDAVIVRNNSPFKTFSDVLWSELNRDYELPREFSAEEFRQILLRKGFIHGMEKMYSVQSTVSGDLRFFWTENNSKVTVSKK